MLSIMFATMLSMQSVSVGDWNRTEVTAEVTLAALSLVDVMQTRAFLHEPHWVGADGQTYAYGEMNPLLGGNFPGAQRLYLSAAGAVLGHAVIAHFLPHTARGIWQAVGIGLEFYIVGHNAHMVGGFSLKF